MKRQAQRELVAEWIAKWRPRLLLERYRIDLSLHNKPDTDDDAYIASCGFGYAGFDADINVYPEFWKLSADLQEKVILHELCHIVVPDTEESVVNHLTEILWIAYPPVVPLTS